MPKLTKPMIRVDPGDHFDGVGWEKIAVNPDNQVAAGDVEYIMWGRKEVFIQSEADYDKSTPEILRARIADNMWPY